MRKLLIVVDFQKDFVDGALGFEGAENLVGIIESKILDYEKNGYDILFTLDTHGPNYLQTMEGKYLPIPHVIKGTEGHEIFGRIQEYSHRHPCIEKGTFGSAKLMDILREREFYDEIELCGLVSNICVISNAVIAKAASPESRIYVDSRATDSYDKEMQSKCFDVMRNLHIEVI
ncbi:cysteine hydrolase family protein [Taylorella asinigenitalis]|uniref:Nicotinamidase n=1 Tax=Taylorella asinigenitalis (strain MCE3) TaxID=1008459 RepID=G4QBD2_TAYAM|nr:isochorismatase family cysteine hydrolase [Taylorella asinigenitalis]AEP36753.1 Nicotinamidase [Taylorella asinigenitalis MCE3]